MKKIFLSGLLILLSILFLSNNLASQEWKWDWASTVNNQDYGTYIWAMHADQYNNIYCRIPYDGQLFLGDTSFNHSGSNYAFAKYNANGKFQFAINALGGDFHYPEILTDLNQNIYIAGDFRHNIVINDSLISMNPGSSINHGEILLCKLNPQNEFVWTGLISSQYSDGLESFCLAPDNNALYLATEHYANVNPHTLNYFNQDTSLPYSTPLNTLVKVDTNCNILWIREVRSEYLGTGCREVFIGQDNNTYLFGNGLAHFYVGEDTIYHPLQNSGEAVTLFWLLKFDQEGNLLNGFYFDWDIWFYELDVDLFGNIYVAGTLYDTAVIGQDTIIVPDGQYYRVIGKFSEELEPYWYRVFEEGEDQNISFRSLELTEDHLIFSGHADGDLQIGDTVFHFGDEYTEVIIGEYNYDGELVNFIATDCSEDIICWHTFLDHCQNLILGGMFTGNAVLGSHSINSTSGTFSDGYLAKILRTDPVPIHIGDDTTVCESMTIYAPEGYPYYVWNNQQTNQDSLKVTQTGEYVLACGDGYGCWYYDTINVAVMPGIFQDLIDDTSMTENDTVVLSVPDVYDSYLWSDGSDSSYMTIVGSEYGIGTFPVWVEVQDGPCTFADTISLTVKSEFGIDDNSFAELQVYPNPFNNSINIEIRPDFQRIEIFDLKGKRFYSKHVFGERKTETIDLEKLDKGVYMLKIQNQKEYFIIKIVRI